MRWRLPTDTLAAGRTYTVTVPAGALEEEATGLALGAVSFSFSTTPGRGDYRYTDGSLGSGRKAAEWSRRRLLWN